MVVVKADLPKEHESIELLVLADYHYGDPHSDHEAIKRDIEYVAAHDNAYCVLAGDLLDCALRSTLGDVYENMSPMAELTALTELFEPIAPKVVCATLGNHENRHYRTNGVDMMRLMMRQLKIEKRYAPDAAVIFLRFGQDTKKNHSRPICYTIYLTHGAGGGRKEGGKVQRLVDYADIIDCDCYIVGHTHLPAALKVDFARINTANSSITYAPHLFVNAAAKLKYGGYGCAGGFKPANTDTNKIIFDGRSKRMEAVI